jgi:hypothetical protein
MSTFPFDAYNISILTVERVGNGLKKQLHNAGMHPLCLHGRYGDQLWIRRDLELPIESRGLKFNAHAWCPSVCSRTDTGENNDKCEPPAK